MLKKAFAVLGLVLLQAASGRAQELVEDPGVVAALELLDVWAEAQRDYEDIPGLSIAVVHDQSVLWSAGFGYADIERRSPAAPNSIYSICSISKLFTAIGVMQLRDQGKLRLDDPVEAHLPWFDIKQSYPDSPPITVQGLLTHSSGLPRESDFPYWTGPEFEFPTREQVIERLSSQETLYPAYKYFQYSNLGLTLAGEIVAELSGRPYASYVQAHILDPLGLESTSPEIPVEHRGGLLATGYGSRGREGERSELTFLQVRGIAPAAGFASTVEDLAKFAAWQFRLLEHGGEEVLRVNTLREMYRVHWVDPDWSTHWGLGFALYRMDDKTFVGHGGGCPGYRSSFLTRPEDKFAAIVMTNAIDANPGRYTNNAYRIVAPAVAKALESKDEVTQPDPALRMYAGTYQTAWGGELAVLPWKDGLALLYLPNDDPLDGLVRLKQAGEHTFRRIRSDEELGEEIVFELDGEGNVVRFKRNSNYYPKVR
ncbi:MAG: serine hydrolase [Gemmatimonadetes bacterium]|nr:serine hydrolase [Gemmatimonadota bacterium]NIO31635.1 serine hydrolase [Gemmatimonadota bacterium]